MWIHPPCSVGIFFLSFWKRKEHICHPLKAFADMTQRELFAVNHLCNISAVWRAAQVTPKLSGNQEEQRLFVLCWQWGVMLAKANSPDFILRAAEWECHFSCGLLILAVFLKNPVISISSTWAAPLNLQYSWPSATVAMENKSSENQCSKFKRLFCCSWYQNTGRNHSDFT